MQSKSTQRHLSDSKLQSVDIATTRAPATRPSQGHILKDNVDFDNLLRDQSIIGVPESRIKRAMDIVGTAIGLFLLSPLFIIIAVLVKLDSPGPAIFKQTRVGKSGKPFTFYKFRSMFNGNSNKIHRQYVTDLIRGDSLEELQGENGSFKIEHDPRITNVGGFLRRTSLDELPQLFNVLKGDMSLVGPRPPLPYEVEVYKPYHKRRLSVMPGITGLWQVSGRTETTFDEMIELDLTYIDEWSLLLDCKILWRTVSTVLNRKGAW